MTTSTAPIIVATDLSPSAANALAIADARSHATGAPLIVCHVMPDDSTRLSPMFPHEHQPLADEGEIAAAERGVREQVGAATQRGEDDYSLRIVRGVASEAISAMAAELSAGLIVVGHGNKGLIARAVIGSTTEQLAKIAKTSLLVVREGPADGLVVAPTDEGEQSRSARVAVSEAKMRDVGTFLVTNTDAVTAAIDRNASLIVVDDASVNDDAVDIVRRAPCSVLVLRGQDDS
jgi:nucleotide-binding universal stress UspA family protein